MSALDDLIARDSGAQGGSALDAVIARDNSTPGSLPMLSPQADARPPLTGFTAAALPVLGKNALNMVTGAVRGAGSIGATLLAPIDIAKDALDGKGLSLDSNRQRRADIDAGLTALTGSDPNTLQYGAGKLSSEVLGTMGVGNAIAAPLKAVSSALPRLAPYVDPLAASVGSGGFSTGSKLPWWASIPVRAVGGAVNGGAAAGLVNPDEAQYGAMIGAAFPLAVWGAGRTGQAIGNAYRTATTSQETKIAQDLANKFGLKADDLRAAVTGPQMIPGYTPTVPQIVQDPTASQLQRTLQTAGQQAVADANGVQQAQMRAALTRIAPVSPTVNDAANRAGTAIQNYAIPAQKAATENVNALFDAIPSSQLQVNLPLQAMQDARTKFLGPGTFGKGGSAVDAAIDEATRIGTTVVPGQPLEYSSSDVASRGPAALNGPRERAPQVVPFNQVQALRSSIGEAIGQAQANGQNNAAAALTQMKNALDNKVADVVGGNAQAGEVVTPQAIDAWGQALKAHADKMRQFGTGPQVSMFRMGADGQPVIQGAEIPPKFYNGNGSQVEDMQAFKRLIGNRDDLAQEMKSFALTQGLSNTTKNGNLANNFINWMQSRSGANRMLFNPSELATINEVGKAVQKQMLVEDLGRVSGPDTAQKLASLQSNGLLDNKVVNALARRIPILGHFTGAGLDALRAGATQARGGIQAGLLADPLRMANAMDQAPGLMNFNPAPLGLLTRGAYPLLLDQ